MGSAAFSSTTFDLLSALCSVVLKRNVSLLAASMFMSLALKLDLPAEGAAVCALTAGPVDNKTRKIAAALRLMFDGLNKNSVNMIQ